MSETEKDSSVVHVSEQLTFDGSVKKQKAIEWLMQNDAIVAGIAQQMRVSPVAGLFTAAEFGKYLTDRVDQVAATMTVTNEERELGYPPPKDDAEREQRRLKVACMRQTAVNFKRKLKGENISLTNFKSNAAYCMRCHTTHKKGECL